jgi:ferredoxin-NAD(P)+ reductase (naphthalene dioxygenase ferredoxin-specific)
VLEAGGRESKSPMVDGAQFVLACQSILAEDCTIEVPELDEIVVHPARIAKATVTAIDDLTHDVKRLLLRLSKPLSYSPGKCVPISSKQAS